MKNLSRSNETRHDFGLGHTFSGKMKMNLLQARNRKPVTASVLVQVYLLSTFCKLPQSRYTRGNVQGGMDNLGTKGGLVLLPPCYRAN
ncbi:hypothetical protein evm_005151 [Chilo suppressalis]|nr:hypothetical protein evm_005151 [Chilo suppressalis]